MRIRRFAALSAAGLFVVALGACASDAKDAANAVRPKAAATTATTMTDEFGAGCAAVPTDPSNPGSFESMAKVPVATAASGNPVLSTLVSAVTAAQLGDSLNSAQGVTVFAPTNDAFAMIPRADLDKVLADRAALTKILTYHVVGERLSPDKLAGEHTTLEGDKLTVTGSGSDFKVNGTASVVCGNVQTANGTVYIIDSVLMPTS